LRSFGGPKAVGALLALASAAPSLAQPTGHVPVLDIRWSLSGNSTQKAASAPAAAERPAAKPVHARKPAKAPQPAVSRPPPIIARHKPGVPAAEPARVSFARAAPLPKAFAARPKAAPAPAPIMAPPPPPPVETVTELAPTPTPHAAKGNQVPLPPLREFAGMLSLIAALAGLVAIWWKSVGARTWQARRYYGRPRPKIDVPLALRSMGGPTEKPRWEDEPAVQSEAREIA
jgi:hypothetical protein